FQNELPYDAPDQAAWQHDGVLGYAAYKVADSVKDHELWGGGSYVYTKVDPSHPAAHRVEVARTPAGRAHPPLPGPPARGAPPHGPPPPPAGGGVRCHWRDLPQSTPSIHRPVADRGLLPTAQDW
ncbi:MAG: hypothetical protein ACTHN8_15195, partial [Angustibacter sp.]